MNSWPVLKLMPHSLSTLYDLLALVEKDETFATCQIFNTKVCYSSRLQSCVSKTTTSVMGPIEGTLSTMALPLTFSTFVRTLNLIVSHPLKNPFLRDIVQIQYLANFLKHVPKSFHGSFEVIGRCCQKHVYSISRHTLIKVVAQSVI